MGRSAESIMATIRVPMTPPFVVWDRPHLAGPDDRPTFIAEDDPTPVFVVHPDNRRGIGVPR